MSLSKIEVAQLTEKAINGTITDRELERLVTELLNKLHKSRDGLDSFYERAVLSSYILYPNNKKLRMNDMEKKIARWRKKLSVT